MHENVYMPRIILISWEFVVFFSWIFVFEFASGRRPDLPFADQLGVADPHDEKGMF